MWPILPNSKHESENGGTTETTGRETSVGVETICWGMLCVPTLCSTRDSCDLGMVGEVSGLETSPLTKLQEDFGLYAAVVHGCQVNLRNPQNQRLLKKGWKLMTTHKRVADMMHMPCKCGRNYQHALCEGNMTRQTAYYTKEFVKRFVAAIKHEMGRKHLVAEMNGETQLPRHFGEGPSCYCKEVHQHGIKLTCGSCQHDLVQGYMTNEEHLT